MLRGISSLLAAALLVCSAGPARAADEPTPLDRALERYWGDERQPEAVHWRLHSKAGRVEVSAHWGLLPNDAFRSYSAPGGSASYFLGESFSVGISVSKVLQQFSKLGGYLHDQLPSPRDRFLDRGEQLLLLASAEAGFIPFYGKVSLLGYKLAHFDFGAYGGVSFAQTRYLDADDVESVGFSPGLGAGLGLRFHPVRWVSLRVDYRQHFLGARDPAREGLSTPASLTFSLGTLFPYPEDRP